MPFNEVKTHVDSSSDIPSNLFGMDLEASGLYKPDLPDLARLGDRVHSYTSQFCSHKGCLQSSCHSHGTSEYCSLLYSLPNLQEQNRRTMRFLKARQTTASIISFLYFPRHPVEEGAACIWTNRVLWDIHYIGKLLLTKWLFVEHTQPIMVFIRNYKSQDCPCSYSQGKFLRPSHNL